MMNEGMKIILERLKTNPEEFESLNDPFASESKWTRLIHKYQNNLPEEDVKAFKDAIDEIRQKEFTAQVMKELLAPEEEDGSLGKPWYTQKHVTLGAGQTPVRSSVTLNNTNALGTWGSSAASSVADAQKYQMEQMKLHLDAHREALKTEQKKHKTLFGKLFNYS